MADHMGVACQQGGLQEPVCKALQLASLMARLNLNTAPGLRSRLTKANHWYHLQVVLQFLGNHQPSLHGCLALVLDDQCIAVDVPKHTALHPLGRVKKVGGAILSTTALCI